MWTDFNVGGVDCAAQFDTQTDDADDRTKVGWLGMRFSQFESLKLDPNKLKQNHAKFGRHRKSRLANHLAKKTTWLPNAFHRGIGGITSYVTSLSMLVMDTWLWWYRREEVCW